MARENREHRKKNDHQQSETRSAWGDSRQEGEGRNRRMPERPPVGKSRCRRAARGNDQHQKPSASPQKRTLFAYRGAPVRRGRKRGEKRTKNTEKREHPRTRVSSERLPPTRSGCGEKNTMVLGEGGGVKQKINDQAQSQGHPLGIHNRIPDDRSKKRPRQLLM